MEIPYSLHEISMDDFVDVMHAYESWRAMNVLVVANSSQGNAKSKHAWDISGHMQS